MLHLKGHAHLILLIVTLMVGVEMLLVLSTARRPYPWRDPAASILVAVGHRLTRGVGGVVLTPVYLSVWDHRLLTLPLGSYWTWAGLFLGVEFLYYWHHRLSHRVRFFWTSHSVHHSSEDLVLAAAYRLPWTDGLGGLWLFWLPLVFLGFNPAAVLGVFGINLVYQIWLHTTLIPKLGPLEWVLNTPSHRRVHHSSEARHLDKNFGGVLILLDRLFGSYAAEVRPPRQYGIAGAAPSYNPFKIALGPWLELGRDLLLAKDWRMRVVILFGPPDGHHPAGMSRGRHEMRRSQP